MAIDVGSPKRSTKRGRSAAPQPAKSHGDIYAVQDSEWDLLDIPVDQIDPNPFNERDMGDLEEMSDDIRDGTFEPTITAMHREKFLAHWESRFPDRCKNLTKPYTIGYGERRWRAAVRAGKKTIKVIVRNGLVPTIRFDLIKENHHRKDPTDIEKARDIQALKEEEGLGYEQICDALKIKSRGTITKYLALLKLPEDVQKAVHAKEISANAARTLLQDLPDDEDRIKALNLIRTKNISAADAIYQLRAAPTSVSNGNVTDAVMVGGAPSDSEPPPGPSLVEPEPASEPVLATSQNIEEASGDQVDDAGEEVETGATGQERRETTTSVTKRQESAPVDSTSERSLAQRERENACVELLRQEILPSAEQISDLLRRALLASSGKTDARSRAHTWLCRSGKAYFDVKHTDGYFQTVLSSGNDKLIELATLATALATNEIRAADRRRPSWDRLDASHLELLITQAQYVPKTQWEKNELTRLGVSIGNDTEAPDRHDQETP